MERGKGGGEGGGEQTMKLRTSECHNKGLTKRGLLLLGNGNVVKIVGRYE